MEVLQGIARDQLGTKQTRKLRREGKTPGIIYGHGEANVAFAVSAHDLNQTLAHGERLVKMEINGAQENFLLKAVQRDAFDNEIIHVDFTRVNLDETVELSVPITLRGTAAGEAAGGVVTPGVTDLLVTCLVTSIPEDVTVRVNDLNIGDVLRVGDLPAIEGLTILTDANTTIASCNLLAEETEAEEGAEGEEPSEPEVIGKGGAEEDEQE